MGRWVDADELVSAAQVAERIDTATANVLTWLKRYPDMPQPVARVGRRRQSPLWVWSELAPWLVEVGVLSARHTVPMTGDPADELLSGKDVAELSAGLTPALLGSCHSTGHSPHQCAPSDPVSGVVETSRNGHRRSRAVHDVVDPGERIHQPTDNAVTGVVSCRHGHGD